MDTANPIAERAVALAADCAERDGAISELVRLAGDQPLPLTDAQAILVRRLRLRSDDYAASGGLTLVNAAVARLGWTGEFTWLPRGVQK